MSEFITEHGEIISDGRSPYQVACSKLVAFKLKAIETVAADPRLREGACTEAMIVYLSFLTIDKDTLQPKPVYASAIKLMARGKMRSKNTAKKARQLLIDCGYLVPAGSETKDGCVWYHVQNPAAERVSMHVAETEEFYTEVDAERRREERRKRRAKDNVVSKIDPTQNERGIKNCSHVGSNNDPKYHRENLRYSLYEGKEPFNSSEHHQTMQPLNEPLPVPKSESETNSTLDLQCKGVNVSPYLRIKLMNMLKLGILTPHMIKNILNQAREDAA